MAQRKQLNAAAQEFYDLGQSEERDAIRAIVERARTSGSGREIRPAVCAEIRAAIDAREVKTT